MGRGATDREIETVCGARSNAGFIGKGVEKIDIAGEYGDQSEITAAGRDKITSVHANTDRLPRPIGDRFYGVPAGSFGTDAIRSGQSTWTHGIERF